VCPGLGEAASHEVHIGWIRAEIGREIYADHAAGHRLGGQLSSATQHDSDIDLCARIDGPDHLRVRKWLTVTSREGNTFSVHHRLLRRQLILSDDLIGGCAALPYRCRTLRPSRVAAHHEGYVEVRLMPWTLIWLLIMGVIIVVLWRCTKRIDKLEDDTSYMYEGSLGGGYGSKFLDILRGRGND